MNRGAEVSRAPRSERAVGEGASAGSLHWKGTRGAALNANAPRGELPKHSSQVVIQVYSADSVSSMFKGNLRRNLTSRTSIALSLPCVRKPAFTA